METRKPHEFQKTYSFQGYGLSTGIWTCDYQKIKVASEADVYRYHLFFVNERMPDGAIAHLYIKRIAQNSVTGKIAYVVILLEYTDFSEVSFDSEELIPTDTFVYSLSSDYIFLYYVNLDNEHHVEYRPTEKSGEHSVIP